MTTTTNKTVAQQIVDQAMAVSTKYYGLPQENFTVKYGTTSNGGNRILLEIVSQDEEPKGSISLYRNESFDALCDVLPEGLYTFANGAHQRVLKGKRIAVPSIFFSASNSAGSDTPYNFHWTNRDTVEAVLELNEETPNVMEFPNQKEKLNAKEANFASAYNRGNKGAAVAQASKGGLGAKIASFFS